jgi:hypothetical protein
MSNYFYKKKELLMKLNSDELNKRILYLINEARNSPNLFSEHIFNDNTDKVIKDLSLFFKCNSREVHPLILDKNLTICSKDLLTHLISIDDGSSIFKYTPEEKIRNSLKERLKRLNLFPIYYNHFIIIGAENSLEAIINLFLNKDYRYKILSSEMNYIGIASGLLPSEKLCIIIDIVNSLTIKNFNITPIKSRNCNCNNYYDTYDNEYNCYDYDHDYVYKSNKKDKDNNNSKQKQYYNSYKMKTEKKNLNAKKIFNLPYFKKHYKSNYNNNINRIKKNDNDVIDLKILNRKLIDLNTNESESFYLDYIPIPKEYKIPVSVIYDKQYRKDKNGKYYPIFTKKSKYDDGSILIQLNNDDLY